MTKVRCAIYTRKSSDEGLDQAFNSLDAQREACAAYILSQASEGWVALPAIYDDGGLSGGTLERPALKRLLADIADGGIDIIVVYKVDRLTRSLFDFAKLVETLDKTGTSFVSVTQSFNTTTSMGRLTLNMLLSFAQFEREVTAERIRDKIAASKAKGMWMGGTPPLGYRPEGRTLAIDPDNAALVQSLYHRYLALGHVRALADALADEGSLVPMRTRANGSTFGGVAWSRGQIYMILQNPIYLGEIHHQGKVHQGLHQPIIDRTLWDAVQAKLQAHRQGARAGQRAPNASMFARRVVDDKGAPLIPVHATKQGKRYRYYVSKAPHHVMGKQAGSENCHAVLRIPARELEAAVIERVLEALRDPLALLPVTATSSPAAIATVIARAHMLTERNADGKHGAQKDTIARLVEQVAVGSEAITIRLDPVALGATLGLEIDAVEPLHCDASIRRCGGVVRLVQSNGQSAAVQPPDVLLVRLIVKARGWWAVLAEGKMTITMLAAREAVTPSYVTRVVRLAFLSPEIIDAISVGKIGADVDQGRLLATDAIAGCWKRQRELLSVK